MLRTSWQRVASFKTEDGLGVIVLNLNAETHFSFTNALGMVSFTQAKAIDIAAAQYPRACWIVALHHHVVEYPKPAKALSERIGTVFGVSACETKQLGCVKEDFWRIVTVKEWR
jgi:hypothetical protein